MNTNEESRDPREAALELIENTAWGDVETDLADVREILERISEAAKGSLWFWEGEGTERYGDEFNVSSSELEQMGDAMRLAYIAQLGVTLRSRLGAGRADGVAWEGSVLGLVERLERAA